jgi:hypothetical protein
VHVPNVDQVLVSHAVSIEHAISGNPVALEQIADANQRLAVNLNDTLSKNKAGVLLIAGLARQKASYHFQLFCKRLPKKLISLLALIKSQAKMDIRLNAQALFFLSFYKDFEKEFEFKKVLLASRVGSRTSCFRVVRVRLRKRKNL